MPRAIVALLAAIAAAAAAVAAGRTRRRAPRAEGDDAPSELRRDWSCGALVHKCDVRPTADGPTAPLAGRTFVAKDNIAVAGCRSRNGSPAWAATEGADAASSHAPVVAALLAAGARCVGKAHMSELALCFRGENGHMGTPPNPKFPKLIPGGSSSGSAAAVAAGLCDFSLGTDTGGSVRTPAACCGVLGFRPTHGALSADGVVPLAPSFDAVGWFARDASTLAAVGDVLLPPASTPPSPRDPKAAPLSPSPSKGGEPPSKILIAEDLFSSCTPPAMAEALLWSAKGAATRLLGGAHVAVVKVGNFLNKQCPEVRAFPKLSLSPSEWVRSQQETAPTSKEAAREGGGGGSKGPLRALCRCATTAICDEIADTAGAWFEGLPSPTKVAADEEEGGKGERGGERGVGKRGKKGSTAHQGCVSALQRHWLVTASAIKEPEGQVKVAAARNALGSVRDALHAALSEGKILILPGLPSPPLPRGASDDAIHAWEDETREAMMLVSSAGLPCAVVPVGRFKRPMAGHAGEVRGAPGAVALVGARGADRAVLAAAQAMQPLLRDAFQSALRTQSKRMQAPAGAGSLPFHAAGATGSHNGASAPDSKKASANGDVVSAHKERGNAAFRSGQFFEASEHYSRGLSIDPKHTVLLSNRAMAFLKLGNYVEAERDCTAALATDPRYVKALLRRGTARAYLGSFQEALGDFERVLQVEPSNAQAAQEIGRIQSAFATPEDDQSV